MSLPLLYLYCMKANQCRDYISGNLTSCLYVLPLLKTLPSSHWQMTSLRSTFESYEAFLSEYQCIPNRQMFKQLTGVEMVTELSPPLPLADYMIHRLAGSLPIKYEELLPKKQFCKWFYALFFKTVIPYGTQWIADKDLIYNPLNLTIIMHLLAHMSAMGYPSHWITDVLLAVIENKVVTTARPPRTSPSTPEEVARDHKERHMTTAPFAEEMKTLLAIFQPALPFSIPSPSIPAQDSIHEYTFSMPKNGMFSSQVTARLSLVFTKPGIMESLATGPARNLNAIMRMGKPPSYREYLDPSMDEQGGDFVPIFVKQDGVNFRKDGIVVWTTFNWDIDKLKASAWMHDGFVDKMIAENWECCPVRVDSWRPVYDEAPLVKNIVKKGKCWV